MSSHDPILLERLIKRLTARVDELESRVTTQRILIEGHENILRNMNERVIALEAQDHGPQKF